MKTAAVTWNTLDWAALDRLRDRFLAGGQGGESYWTSRSDLANYNFTYAQRIGWKWDAVLRELKMRKWTPPSKVLLDWGCGSGIASRLGIDCFGAEQFEMLRVFDRSPLAVDFAIEAAQRRFPSLRVEVWTEQGSAVPLLGGDRGGFTGPTVNTPTLMHAPAAPREKKLGTLVISHVLNELDEAGVRSLRELIDQADAVLWVEPGTYADSRSLIAMREYLREQFHVIAPCTHQAGCGLRVPENERHWCHHFAAPPAGIMADSNWVRFAQRAGIDLRSLPYSFVVLERKGLRDPVPGLVPDGYSRIIGEPRFYKGYARIFSCQLAGARELELQKRDGPELFKALKKGEAERVRRWSFEGGRIKAA